MRVSNSLEPGNGPRSVEEYRAFLGRYMTEGVQSVESVCPAMEKMFHDEGIRKCVEENVPLTQLIGKYHVPPAKVAYLFSNREMERLVYPWKPDASKVLPMGYHGWYCDLEYPSAALMESDFLKDRAGPFAVVIDGNTQIMDERTVDGIERYVRNGGVFVTLGQTGRHTETQSDRWPISRLTGYKVVAIDPRAPDGAEHQHPGGLDDPLPDNGIFQLKRWRDSKLGIDSLPWANGLSLEKVASECRDLIQWKDGTTAAGIRPLGRGYVVNMGVVFGRYGSSPLMRKLLEDIVLWRGVTARTPGQIYPAVIADAASLPKQVKAAPGAAYVLSAVAAACRNVYPYDLRGFPWAYQDVLFRHYQSNNGLHDVWALYNQSPSASRTVDVTFRDGVDPAFAIDVRLNKKAAIAREGGIPKLQGIRLRPLETRVFLTPRGDISQAGLEWFALQRAWWRSTYTPGRHLPPVSHKFTVDLFDGWAFKPLEGQTDAEIAALAGPGADDAAWDCRPLGIWTTPKKQNVRHGLLRRWVEIPRTWDKGAVKLWLSAWYMGTFYDRGTLYLDGEKCPTFSPFYGQDVTGKFQPGTRHLVAIEVNSDGQLTGVAGNCWLYYTPEPLARTALAGKWTSSKDMIHYDGNVSLPGPIVGQSVRRDDLILDGSRNGCNVVLFVDSDTRIHGAIVNGHWVSRFHHLLSPYLELNITPWVTFDKPNVIELARFGENSPRPTRSIEIRYYAPGEYP
jgi:hypothetical protein